MRKEIRIVLEEDNIQFLEMARGKKRATTSDFLNSLLRQERYRQGFPVYFRKPAPFKPHITWREKWMLLCSGLLPLPRAFRP